MRADLELHRRAKRPEQGRVQRLVAVHLRDGDVVLELAGHRLVQRVQGTEGQVAVLARVDDDAKAVDVEHLGEGQALLDHLAVDAVDVLLAALDLGLDPGLRQRAPHRLVDLAEHLAPVAARGQHRLAQHPEAQRVHAGEALLLQFAVDGVQPEAVRDRRIDLERFARDTPLFLGLHRLQRAHVVQPVGQLDQDDPHVAAHRQQHLAEALGLRLLVRVEAQPVQLGHPVDQFRHHWPEALDHLLLAHAGVFEHVVHQRSLDRRRVEFPVGEQLGHGHRVGDVGLAALAELAEVGRIGEAERLLDADDLG